jgi:hypothetical protein
MFQKGSRQHPRKLLSSKRRNWRSWVVRRVKVLCRKTPGSSQRTDAQQRKLVGGTECDRERRNNAGYRKNPDRNWSEPIAKKIARAVSSFQGFELRLILQQLSSIEQARQLSPAQIWF